MAMRPPPLLPPLAALHWPATTAAAAQANENSGFTLEDLLQELCMALMGYSGDVFVCDTGDDQSAEVLPVRPSGESANAVIRMADGVLLATGVSKEQLNQVAMLGFHYRQLQRFILQERQPLDGHTSMYRRALCSGLEEVCCVYEDEVVRLQEQLLQEGAAASGLASISYQLADLQRLMPQLHQLAYELRRRNPRTLGPEERTLARTGAVGRGSMYNDGDDDGDDDGGFCADLLQQPGLVLMAPSCGARLLHWLHDRRLNGEPLLQACIQRLLWHVNQVVFNQLTMWMAHGLLVDNGAEFFIRPRADAGPIDGIPDCGGGLAAAGDDLRQQRATADAASLDAASSLAAEEACSYRDFHAAFEVALTELPPGISPHTATSIEFVGRAVRLLRSPPASAKLSALQDSYATSCAAQQEAGSGSAVLQHQQQQLLPYDDAMAYAAALRVLQQQPVYSEAALQRTVEAIRADVASRLWQLLVVQSGLMEHLSAIKDYMLLAKGDFYQCFLADDAAKLLGDDLQAAKGSAATKDLAVPWAAAAAKSTAADDPHFKHFTIVFDGPSAAAAQQPAKPAAATDTAAPAAAATTEAAAAAAAAGGMAPGGIAKAATAEVPSYDKWDNLRIAASLPWPLGVLVTQAHLATYNSFFRVLLRLKRVQLGLETGWQEVGRLCSRKGGREGAAHISDLLQLRQHLQHLINNLQIYLQQDVIETHYDVLQQRVAAAQDFAAIEYAHAQFVATMAGHSVMTQTGVWATPLAEVFAVARDLSQLVQHAAERGIDCDLLAELKVRFEAAIHTVYTTVRSKRLQANGAQVDKLWSRLNFNGVAAWYSSTKSAQDNKNKQPSQQQLSPYKMDRLAKEQQQQQQQQQQQAGVERGIAAMRVTAR